MKILLRIDFRQWIVRTVEVSEVFEPKIYNLKRDLDNKICISIFLLPFRQNHCILNEKIKKIPQIGPYFQPADRMQKNESVDISNDT